MKQSMFIIFGAREGMKSFNRFNFVFISSVILMVLCGVSWVNDAVSSENETGEVIVASGDDFVLTQKEVDAYKIFFKNQGIALPPQKEVLIRHLIKGELFANEIRKKQAMTENLDMSMDDQKKIEVKLQLTTEYVKKLLEEYKYVYFEEPVMYDHFEEIKEVADALTLPVANGEQDQSFVHFRWSIANDGLDIVQPDNYYFGGLIRSMKVARMADAFGKTIVPHMSGGGLGFLYNMQFVSVVPNAGVHHEFKGLDSNVPFECPTSPLKVVNGKLKVPTGPGSGVNIDPEFIRKHQVVKG